MEDLVSELDAIDVLQEALKKEDEKMQQEKANDKLTKAVLNIIRTTMRNNIELTSIADNKANVLLTLNALMITFLIPFAIPYLDIIKEYKLGYALVILVATCLITIYIASLVLKPGNFDANASNINKGKYFSPFFFGNFFKMPKIEYEAYMRQAVSDRFKVKSYVVDDLHYFGSRLGRKMSLIRLAFNIFQTGLMLSIVLAGICLIVFG